MMHLFSALASVYKQKRPAGILSQRRGRCGPPAGAALRSQPTLCPKAFWARVPGEATPDPYFFFFYLANKFQGFQLMFTLSTNATTYLQHPFSDFMNMLAATEHRIGSQIA